MHPITTPSRVRGYIDYPYCGFCSILNARVLMKRFMTYGVCNREFQKTTKPMPGYPYNNQNRNNQNRKNPPPSSAPDTNPPLPALHYRILPYSHIESQYQLRYRNRHHADIWPDKEPGNWPKCCFSQAGSQRGVESLLRDFAGGDLELLGRVEVEVVGGGGMRREKGVEGGKRMVSQ